MILMKYKCPRCGEKMRFPLEAIGQTKKCAACGYDFEVLAPAGYEPPGPNPKLEIICPNPHCGYRGQGQVRGGHDFGDYLLGFFLMLCGLIPGLIFLCTLKRPELICPKCGMRVR